MNKKRFTVQEANRMLPVLREVVGAIQERLGWMTANRPQVDYLVKKHSVPMESPVPHDYLANLLAVRGALARLESFGCQLKDVQMGLVDFPARLSGREVLLCWSLEEDSVGFYHDLRGGYAGRRPIPGGRGSGENDPGNESSEEEGH